MPFVIEYEATPNGCLGFIPDTYNRLFENSPRENGTDIIDNIHDTS